MYRNWKERQREKWITLTKARKQVRKFLSRTENYVGRLAVQIEKGETVPFVMLLHGDMPKSTEGLEEGHHEQIQKRKTALTL